MSRAILSDELTRNFPKRCLQDDSSIAARVLGLVKSAIGERQYFVRGTRCRSNHGAANAGAELKSRAAGAHRILGDSRTNSLGYADRLGGTAARQHNQKFFATVASNTIERADRTGKAGGCLFQYGIARKMTMCIVDPFEVVEVKH